METAAMALALVLAFFFLLVLNLFLREVGQRWRRCGSLRRALLEARVEAPLGEYDAALFGTFSSRLRIFRKDDRAGRPAFLIFEVGRRGWLAFDRFDYAIAREDWRRLAMLLRRAAGEGEEK